MKQIIALILVILTADQLTWSQISVPFTSSEWKFETKDYQLEEYLGKPAIRLNKNRATLPSAKFENGVIEYDVAFPQGRAFIEVGFRMQDDANYEEFYFRPHQSGNPDANQYSPVYNGVAAWQLYYGEGYGTPITYNFNKWMHVKLVVSGSYMEVYLDNMENPILFSELKRPVQSGYLGLGNFMSENHFANFTYTPLDKVVLKGTPKPKAPPAGGVITQWQVSNSLPEKSFENLLSLKQFPKTSVAWKTVETENTGTVNLASVASFTPETNTVLVRVTIYSDKDQIKKFTFGFSDRIRVFLNDNLLYAGEDNFLSRDYRFLGTIGFFDSVYLNLKKGNNDIVLAVSESFGGWGIKAKLEDMSAIKLASANKL